MPESLRDRVARVLYEVTTAGFAEVSSFDDAHEFDKADHYVAADALIAAGLVAECGEPPGTAFEVMATRHGLPIMLYHGAHDNPLRVRSWTHDGDRFLVEYVEVTS